MRSRLTLLAGVIVLFFTWTAASPARADELIFRTLAGLTPADVSANLQALRDDFAQAPLDARRLGAAIAAALGDGTAVRAVTFVLILVIAGAGLEWLYWTFAAAPLRAIIATSAATPREAAVLALRRLGLLGFGLVLFTASVMGAVLILPWPANVDAIVIAATVLVVAVRSAWIIADVVVSPHHPSLRLAPIQQYKSGLVVGCVAWLSLLAAMAILFPQLLTTVALAPHLAATIRVGVGALIVISLLIAVLILSRQASGPGKGRRERPRFPKAFVATFVIVATAILALVGGGRIAALLLDAAIVAALLSASRPIVFFFCRDATGKGEEPVTEAPPDMLPLIVLAVVRYAALLIGIAGLIVIMRVPLAALTTGSNPLARLALRVGDTVALAFVVHLGWIAARFAIDRRLRQLAPFDPHSPPTENTRLLTLLPLLRTTTAVVLVTLFTLSALWTLGIQIAPLLAGAGIFGLAIGFGAQTLVRDVISGVFFLIEDVFRIGEYIESGTITKGTVEHISFRTVALRHHNGPLTFVPYGLLGSVRNDSRDWVIDKFNLPLPLSVDSEKIRKMIKAIGEDMTLDPELGQLIREPLKGKLYRVDPGVKTFRCKFMTAPGCQFDLRTAALKKIEAALVEAGICFAGADPQTILVGRAPDPLRSKASPVKNA
jgi:moderate conductance mechanosensitive channel